MLSNEITPREIEIIEIIRKSGDYSKLVIEKRAGKLVRIVIEESVLLDKNDKNMV